MTTDKEELRKEFVSKFCFTTSLGNITLNVLDPLKYVDWFYSKLEAKDKEYASKIAAGDRLRMEDAMSAINEANELREKIKEQELIIHGIEEGAEQWKSLCADKDKELAELKIQLSNYAYQIDMAKRERDNAENSNQSLAKQITDLKAEIEASSAYISATETAYTKCQSNLIDAKAEIEMLKGEKDKIHNTKP